LRTHSNVILHFREVIEIIMADNDPKSICHLMQIAAALMAKCIAKISKFEGKQSTQSILKHLDRCGILSQRLHKIIYEIKKRERPALQGEKSAIKWSKVREKTKKLNKNLESLMLKTNTFARSKGIKNTSLRTMKIKQQSQSLSAEQNDKEEADDDEEEEESEQDSDEEEEESDSD